MLLCAHGRGHVLLLVVELIVAGLGTANQLGQRVLLLTNKYIFKYMICFLKIIFSPVVGSVCMISCFVSIG